ncbi:phosphoglucomutase [Streptomyces sp. SPB162]|nr:phosphoglucomutase [Streptomyces sp. SPB162]
MSGERGTGGSCWVGVGTTGANEDVGRPLVEVPFGSEWFVNGPFDSTLGFGGQESAGASCLRRNSSAWTTDKGGIILALLARGDIEGAAANTSWAGRPLGTGDSCKSYGESILGQDHPRLVQKEARSVVAAGLGA